MEDALWQQNGDQLYQTTFYLMQGTITWVNTNTLMWELMGTVTWVNTNFAQEKKHQSKKYYLLFKVKITKVKSTTYSE